MPSKDEGTTDKESTLKDIEKRLCRIENCLKSQGKETVLGAWRTIAIFGGSIIIVGVGLWIEKYISSPIYFKIACVFLFIYGFVTVVCARRQYLKIKRKPKLKSEL